MWYIKYSEYWYGTCYPLRWYICMVWLALVEIPYFRKMLFKWNNCRFYSKDIRLVKIYLNINIYTLHAFNQTVRRSV